MKITYDKEADALYIKLTDQPIADSEEVEPRVVVDYDENEQIAGIEILYFLQKHSSELFPAFKAAAVWQREYRNGGVGDLSCPSQNHKNHGSDNGSRWVTKLTTIDFPFSPSLGRDSPIRKHLPLLRNSILRHRVLCEKLGHNIKNLCYNFLVLNILNL